MNGVALPGCPGDLAAMLAGRAGPAGVRAALCGPRARAVLHRALLAELPPGTAVQTRITRSTFKPGRRLRAYYEVMVDGPEPDRRRIAVTWAATGTGPEPGSAEPGSAEQVEAELRDRGLAGPFARLRHEDPELGLQLLVAPLDPAFPQLARLCDPAYLRSRLGEHRVRAVRYRPGQRHVLRLDPCGPGTGLFVKVYPGRAAQVWAAGAGMARLLGAAGAEHQPVPMLLPDDDAVIWPAVPGAPLSWWLRRDPPRVAARLAEAGALLRAIHDTRPDRAPHGLPAGPRVEAELAAIRRTAGHIGALLPPLGRRIAKIMDRAGDRLAGLSDEPPTLVHGDFKADHLLAGPDRLTLIDLDRCGWSDPARDLAKFLADLRWWTRASRPAVADALRAGFLAGYGTCPGERLARLRALEPPLLVKMAARRPRLHDPSWARHTVQLVEQAERRTAVPDATKAVA